MTDARPKVAKVLVVDDDPSIRMLVSLALEDFLVVTAEDGLEGLRAVESMPFDAIVLDIQMPRMDGHAMAAALREKGYDIPILVLSAFGKRAIGQVPNVQASLAKPFDIDELSRRVHELIRARYGDGNHTS